MAGLLLWGHRARVTGARSPARRSRPQGRQPVAPPGHAGRPRQVVPPVRLVRHSAGRSRAVCPCAPAYDPSIRRTGHRPLRCGDASHPCPSLSIPPCSLAGNGVYVAQVHVAPMPPEPSVALSVARKATLASPADLRSIERPHVLRDSSDAQRPSGPRTGHAALWIRGACISAVRGAPSGSANPTETHAPAPRGWAVIGT